MNGSPAALIAPWYPMLNCADIVSLPVNFAVTNASNTVYIAGSAADILAGIVGIVGQMALEALIYLIVSKLAHLLPHKTLFQKFVMYMTKKALMYVLKYIAYKTKLVKTLKEKARELVDPSSPSTVALVTSSPFGDATIHVAPTGREGTFAVTSTAPAPNGGSAHRHHGNVTTFGESPDVPDPFTALAERSPML